MSEPERTALRAIVYKEMFSIIVTTDPKHFEKMASEITDSCMQLLEATAREVIGQPELAQGKYAPLPERDLDLVIRNKLRAEQQDRLAALIRGEGKEDHV